MLSYDYTGKCNEVYIEACAITLKNSIFDGYTCRWMSIGYSNTINGVIVIFFQSHEQFLAKF